jgi:hypothetical protein
VLALDGLVEGERNGDAAWGARFASAKWGPAPGGVIESGEPGGLAGGVAVLFLAVALCCWGGVEDSAARVEAGQTVLAVRSGAFADGVSAVAHEHQVDPDDVGELAGFAAFGAAAPEGPAHHAQDTFLAQQRHRFGLAERFAGQRDGGGGFRGGLGGCRALPPLCPGGR